MRGKLSRLKFVPLTIAGFYDPPFKIRAEEAVQLTLADSEEVLQGGLDVLALKDQLWVVVLEAKKTAISVWAALPQTLAYLMATPQSQLPQFGLITNGDDSVFIKLTQTDRRQYNFSRSFSALTSNQELCSILQVLKRIAKVMGPV
ncbi:MAG: type I restriction enzyme HsdR N-terminal domain-containing protein [Thermosynechococcaceae cyanobacterium]